MLVRAGLLLWATGIVPSLFPFFVATELLNHTKIPTICGRFLSKFMKPLFNVPGEGGYSFIMGIICGYPTGAKIVSNFYSNNICTKSQAERLLAFTNNSGPLFIVGTVGVTFFGNTEIGILLLITHLLSAISVGLIFGLFSRILEKTSHSRYEQSPTNYNKTKINNLGEILFSSITSAIYTLFIIGGFVVLFSVIISILTTIFFSNLNIYCSSIITGIIELTNGLSLASSIVCKNISYNIIICAFLLGFGGISVLLQVFTISAKNQLSIKWYFYGKLLQGLLASFYTYIFLNNFINFNL